MMRRMRTVITIVAAASFAALAPAAPQASPSVASISAGALVAIMIGGGGIVGSIIGWATFAMKVREFRDGRVDRARKEEEQLEDVIRRVCREFTSSDDYELRLTRLMVATAVNVTDEQFRERSSSFADAKVFDSYARSTEVRIAAIETRMTATLTALRKDIGDLSDEVKGAARTIAAEVIAEMKR